MQERPIVYVVTEGEYSDYHIVAVFSDRESAQALVDVKDPNDYDKRQIEEYWLNGGPVAQLTEYRVWVDKNGVETGRNETTKPDTKPDEVTEQSWNMGRYQGGAGAMSTRGYDVALKIARDKLAEQKARETGY